MHNHSIDPHDTPLDVLFPSWPPEKRQELRDFLDGYCEVALQVFERLEHDPKGQEELDYLSWQRKAKKMVDSVQRRPQKGEKNNPP